MRCSGVVAALLVLGFFAAPASGADGGDPCGAVDCRSATLDEVVAATLRGEPPLAPGSTPEEIVFSDVMREALDRLRQDTVEAVSRSSGSDPTAGVDWESGTEHGVVFLRPPSSANIVLGRSSIGDANSIALRGETDPHVVGGAHSHPTRQWRAGGSATEAWNSSGGEFSYGDIAHFMAKDRWIFDLAIADTGRVFLALRTRATDASYSYGFIKHLGNLFDCWNSSTESAGLSLLAEFLQIELYEGDSRSVRRQRSEEHRVEALRLRAEKRIGPEEEARRLTRWERILIQTISRERKGYTGPLDGKLTGPQREMVREYQRSIGDPETGFITRFQRARLFSDAGAVWDSDGAHAEVHVGFSGRLTDGATGKGVQVRCNADHVRDGTWTSNGRFEGYEERPLTDGGRIEAHISPAGITGSEYDANGREVWRGGFIIERDESGARTWSDDGLGVYFFPTGERWEGRAVKGRFVGEGVLIYPDGKRRRATWKWTGTQQQLEVFQ